MSNITGENTWEPNVYNFEETDVVKGGPDGVDNVPLKQLANRTTWLKNALRGYDGIKSVTANATLTKADIFQKLVVIDANFASIEILLPVLDVADAGLRVAMVTYRVGNQVTITSQASTADIMFGSNTRLKLFMGNADSVELIWIGTSWILASFNGNFSEVGMPDYGYTQKANTVIANGSLISRTAFPRLWEYAQSLGTSIVSDATWTGVADYKGFFSTGNGSTTFRVPDLRGMFLRGLDLSRGISFGRNSENPGGYEADEFKAHSHGYEGVTNPSGGGDGGRKSVPAGKQTDTVGGLETRAKNIGLIPLIKA